MSERFFSSVPITTDLVTLDGQEAHHLLHVMRAGAGTPITLFDNNGAEFAAVVETTRRAEAIVRILERLEINRELPFELVAGVALPKGDRQKWLVEKLTELGVTSLVPLVTERGVAQPTTSAIERLERSVIEAAKQCGRNRLMQIAEPQSWDEWIKGDCGLRIAVCGLSEQSEIRNPKSEICRHLIAHPNGQSLHDINFQSPLPTAITIGPEGGLTDAEVAAALTAGWQQVSLGSSILRVETAAIALAAAIALR